MSVFAKHRIGADLTLYDLVDGLFGSRIGSTLNELLIKGCMEFLDEGQAVWRMPGRKRGMFSAWCEVAKRNRRLRLRGLDVGRLLAAVDRPEPAIDHVMGALQIPENLWMSYFTLELAHLHGWAGFVRWRAQASDYYWQQRNPADLVDFLAIRLVLSLGLMEDAEKHYRRNFRYSSLVRFLDEHPHECLLRHELCSGEILPHFAHAVEVALHDGNAARIEALSLDYQRAKTIRAAAIRAARLQELCEEAGTPRVVLATMDEGRLTRTIEAVHAFKSREGPVMMEALERTYIDALLGALFAAGEVSSPAGGQAAGQKVQALFCIDVRSERFRRHLEQVGNYDTYGVAGYFGVPVSFIEFGKGHEAALCPAIVTPSNVALEMPHKHEDHDQPLFHIATEVAHDLKKTVLAPYVTVEAIGLLFGLDMVGRTLAPAAYGTWRKRLENGRRPTTLMIEKITREDALDLIANLQDEMVVKAIDRHFGIKRESLTTQMIGEIREIALGNARGPSLLCRRFGLDSASETLFMTSLRVEYQVNRDQQKLQLEQLARLGFSIETQAKLVANTLRAIGLTEDFAKLVLIVGHGSSSQNNPYESALDCGACGGEHGLVNARIFAAMANKSEVRALLARKGVVIPDDTWFVPALHNTTTDETLLHDLDQVPAGRQTYLNRIQEDLTAAGRLSARERCAQLAEPADGSPMAAAAAVKRRSMDWAQVRPEWGLSKNASFIVGRRALTRELDLQGRAFLHSYDHRKDEAGKRLEAILSGPLIVAQRINMEHYFSVVDNEVFGSGSKVYHNVVGRFGVMTGNVSDLRTGLPAQTVFQGDRPYHEPMRLVTVVEAPLPFVERVLSRIYKVRELVHNGWLRFVVVDVEAGAAHLFERGGWTPLHRFLARDEVFDICAPGQRAEPFLQPSETVGELIS
ncbi:MAG: DUF2309 domain-containing protein [Rhodocyclaceae bacterium]